MITLISTPEYIEQASPEIVCRWVATESPNNFRLLRHDFDIVTAVNNGGYLRLTVAAGTFTGQIGDIISVYNKTLDAMFTGTVGAGSGTTTVNTNIVYQTGFAPTDTAKDPERTFTYINDYTLRAGYYFEGRLTINGVVNPLTIVATPDSFGYADLDVSGVLRTVTSLGKDGDYTETIMKEETKSGNFYLEYRDCWYTNLTNDYVIAEQTGSPATYPLWYYAEAVRSEEQGSNLHEYEPDDINDAPFFNSFENPVFFLGLPFDLSFILPERAVISPTSQITVTIKRYNNSHVLLGTEITNVDADALEGHVCSLSIDPAGIEAVAAYLTAEITAS